MFPAVFPEKDSDSAENVIHVGIIEAESQEEKGLGDEIALKRRREKMSSRLVGFVIVFGNDGLISLGNVAMHFVNNGVSSWHGRREILYGGFNIGNLSVGLKRILD